jgi:hypothetical protein
MMWSGCQLSRFDRAGLVDVRCLTSWVFVHARSFMCGCPPEATHNIRSKYRRIFKRPHLISASESHRPSHPRLLKLPTKITTNLTPPTANTTVAVARASERDQAGPGAGALRRGAARGFEAETFDFPPIARGKTAPIKSGLHDRIQIQY